MDWFALEDSRCHDGRCAGVLDALDRALSFERTAASAGASGSLAPVPPASVDPGSAAAPGYGAPASRPRSTVMLLRALALRLAEDPTIATVPLGLLLGAPPVSREPTLVAAFDADTRTPERSREGARHP